MSSIFDGLSGEQKKFVRAIIDNAWGHAHQDESVPSSDIQNKIIERTDADSTLGLLRRRRAGLMGVLRDALLRTEDSGVHLRIETATKAILDYGYDHVDIMYSNLLEFIGDVADPSGGVAPELTVQNVLDYMKEPRGRSEFKVRYGYSPIKTG